MKNQKTKLLIATIYVFLGLLICYYIEFGFFTLSVFEFNSQNRSNSSDKSFVTAISDFAIDNKRYISQSADPWILIDTKGEKYKYIHVHISNIKRGQSVAQIYYSDINEFSEKYSFSQVIHNGSNTLRLPAEMPINFLRLDLASEPNFTFELNDILLSNNLIYSDRFYFYLSFYLLGFFIIVILLYSKRTPVLIDRFKSSLSFSHHEVAYVLLCFAIYYTWSTILPYNKAPDEYMRYNIPLYIYNHNTLPVGNEPEMIDSTWGFSYAFTPIVSYIFGALFMKIADVFGLAYSNLFHAARQVSVISSTITAYFVIKIGKELFNGVTKWLFIIFVTLLPQFIFISSYVNNDAFAIMASSIIIYYWIIGLKNYWNIRACIGLSIGISLCILSYYNAYGFILCSIIIFIISILKMNKTHTFRSDILKKIGIMCAIVILLSAWWFIRSYILFDGDILGFRTTTKYSEMYAIDAIKPSNRITPAKIGQSILSMLVTTDFITTSVISFIGVFDYMSLYLNKMQYIFYLALSVIGIIGLMFVYLRSSKRLKSQRLFENSYDNIFQSVMLISIIIPIMMSIIFSYYNGYSPQGRYILPSIIPIMVFITYGYRNLYSLNQATNQKIDRIYKMIIYLYIINCIYILTNTIIPYYYW